MRPGLLRPPFEVLPSVSDLTGPPLRRPERSTSTSWRVPGVRGLYCFSAILQTRRDVDLVALFQGHDRFLEIAARIDLAAGSLALALDDHRVHRLDLDLEQVGNRLGDCGLGGVQGDAEHDLIALGHARRLFG